LAMPGLLLGCGSVPSDAMRTDKTPARAASFGPGLKGSVVVHEVGPRDGLQNEARTVDVATKAEFVRRLVAAGVRSIELTSFVRPDRVPQLADAEELLASLDLPPGVRTLALVPNQRGLARALEHPIHAVGVLASVTESFAQANLGRSVDEALAMLAPVVAGAHQAGRTVRAYLSMCFGDPWEGPVAPAQVVAVASRLLEAGADELSLGDTIGVATAGHVRALLEALAEAGIGAERLAVHFHDTYGQALANTLVALSYGITNVDSSAGGIGGCPFARSATGNLATEDLVWMTAGLGVDTGIDLDALVATSVWMAEQLGRPSPSGVVRALRGRE
jgi:hydroxymethylglutaryl-CoA lyase